MVKSSDRRLKMLISQLSLISMEFWLQVAIPGSLLQALLSVSHSEPDRLQESFV